MIDVSYNCEENIQPQSSLSDLSHRTTLFTKVKNSLKGSNISLIGEMEPQEDSSGAVPTVKIFQEFRYKTNPVSQIHQSLLKEKKYKIPNVRSFFSSKVMFPTLKPPRKLDSR